MSNPYARRFDKQRQREEREKRAVQRAAANEERYVQYNEKAAQEALLAQARAVFEKMMSQSQEDYEDEQKRPVVEQGPNRSQMLREAALKMLRRLMASVQQAITDRRPLLVAEEIILSLNERLARQINRTAAYVSDIAGRRNLVFADIGSVSAVVTAGAAITGAIAYASVNLPSVSFSPQEIVHRLGEFQQGVEDFTAATLSYIAYGVVAYGAYAIAKNETARSIIGGTIRTAANVIYAGYQTARDVIQSMPSISVITAVPTARGWSYFVDRPSERANIFVSNLDSVQRTLREMSDNLKRQADDYEQRLRQWDSDLSLAQYRLSEMGRAEYEADLEGRRKALAELDAVQSRLTEMKEQDENEEKSIQVPSPKVVRPGNLQELADALQKALEELDQRLSMHDLEADREERKRLLARLEETKLKLREYYKKPEEEKKNEEIQVPDMESSSSWTEWLMNMFRTPQEEIDEYLQMYNDSDRGAIPKPLIGAKIDDPNPSLQKISTPPNLPPKLEPVPPPLGPLPLLPVPEPKPEIKPEPQVRPEPRPPITRADLGDDMSVQKNYSIKSRPDISIHSVYLGSRPIKKSKLLFT